MNVSEDSGSGVPTLYCISCDGRELLILPDKGSAEEAEAYSLDGLEDHCRYFPEFAILDGDHVIVSQWILRITGTGVTPMERVEGKLLASDDRTILTRIDGESGDTLVLNTWNGGRMRQTSKHYPDMDILHALDPKTIVLSTRGDRSNRRELSVAKYSLGGNDRIVYRFPYTQATVGFGVGSLAIYDKGSVTVVNSEGKGIVIPFRPTVKVKSIHPFTLEGGGGFWVRYDNDTTEAHYSNRDPVKTPDVTSDLNFPIAENALVTNGTTILSFSREGVSIFDLPVPVQNVAIYYSDDDE
jgi:hypothetical protein